MILQYTLANPNSLAPNKNSIVRFTELFRLVKSFILMGEYISESHESNYLYCTRIYIINRNIDVQFYLLFNCIITSTLILSKYPFYEIKICLNPQLGFGLTRFGLTRVYCISASKSNYLHGLILIHYKRLLLS